MTLKQLELIEPLDIEGAKAGSGKAYKPVREDDSTATIAYLSVLYGLSEGVVRGFGVNAWTVDELKKSVFLDGTPIMSQDGTILHEDVEVDFRYGTIDQTPIEGMPSVTIESVVGVEVRAGTPVTRNFLRKEANSYDVRISIPRLMQNTNEGDSRKGAVTFAIDVATGTGSFSQYGVYTINEKITQGFQRTYNITIPQAASRSIRVRKITPDGDNTLTFNDITLEAITEVVEVRLAYPHTALLWLKYDARNFSNAPKVEVLLHGIADMQIPMNYNPDTRQYATSGAGTTNGVWNGQFKTGYTDNPAWHWFLMATNKRYSLGNKITESLTNKFYLYSLAKYCDELVPDGKGGQEPRFTCNNLYLQKQEDAFKVMKDLASVFRAKTIWDGMYLTPKMDTPRDAMLVFSRANVNNITYASTSSAAQHNVVAVQFYDTDNHYDTKFAYARSVENIRQRGRIEQIEVTALGCTSEGQAQRYADYLLNTELLETELISFTTGLDGMRPVVGDVFVFADDLVAGKATSGRVVSVAGDKVVVDRDLNIALDVGGTFIANTTETLASTRTITAIAADKRTVTLSSAINVVDITGLVWAVKSSNVGLREYTVDDVSYDADTFTFAVTGIKYARGKYSSADNAAHIVEPPLTLIEPLFPKQPDTVTAKYYVVVDQGMNLSNIEAAWSQVTSAAKYELEMRRDGAEWRKLGETQSLTYTVENAYAGVYEFRVRSFDVVGNASMYRVSAPLLVQGKILPPPTLEQLTAKGELFAIRADWVYPAASEDSLSVVIEINTEDPTVSTVNKTTMEVAYPATSFTFTGLSAHARLWLRAAIKDRYGNVGAFTVWTDATADSNPSAILDIIEGEINAGTLDQALRDKIEIGTVAAETAALAQLAADAASQAAINASSASALAQVSADAAKTAADSASNAVAQEVYDRQVAVAGEAGTRREAVIALSDGLTQETNARTDGDSTLLSNINTYKASNDNALASVRNQTTVNTDALSSQAEQLTQLDAGLTDTAQLLSSNIVRVNDIDGKVESHAEQLTNINASLQGKADANVLNSLSSTVTEIDGKVVANTQELSAQSTRLANAELGVTNNASAISKTYTKTEADEVIAGKIESYDANLVIGGANLMEYTSGNAAIYGAQITYDAVTNSFIKPSGAISYTAFRLASFRPKIGEVYTVSGYLYIDGNPATHSNYWSPSSVINRFQKNIDNVIANSDGYFFGTFEIVTLDEWLALHFLYPDPVIFDETTHTLAFKDLQLEKGSKPSAYSKPAYELAKTLNANANAIQTVTAEVSRIDGVTTAHSGQLTSLSASIDTINGNLIRKADATALNELSADVSDINGRVVAQALQTTNLTSRVEGAEGSILNVQHTVSELDASTSTALQQLKSSTEDTGEISRLLNGAAAIFEDFNFSLGLNGVEIYNNLYNGTVAAAWQDKTPDNPIVATRQLGFTHTGAASPAHGGFYQAVVVRPNAVFVHKFVAKLPIGYAFNPASNAIGDGSENYILGSAAGTGKFETYYIVVRAGATGSFSTTGFVYVTGNGLPLSWVLASATIYDCSDSKLVPTSVSNAIATAQSTANTATSNLSALAGRTDTLQSQLSTVSGAVATKLDATVINDYYTRVEADEAAAGEVSRYDAKLVIGGTNLLLNSDFSGDASWSKWGDHGGGYVKVTDPTYGDVLQTNLPSGLIHDWVKLENNVEYTYSALVKPSNDLYQNGDTPLHYWAGKDNVHQNKIYVLRASHGRIEAGKWTRISIVFKLVDDADSFRPFIYGLSGVLQLAWTKLERGNKATDWSPNNAEVQQSINANATAIQQTKADVVTVDNRVTATSMNLGQVSARADNALKLLKIEDTRYANATPRWYWDNYPYRTVKEFKENAYIGAEGFLGHAFCYLETDVYYGDPSGGAIIQTATSASNPADYVQRVSTGLDTWGGWSQPLKQLKTNIEGVAYATQLLNSRVDSVDGRITAEAEETSNLFASLDQKIDLSVTNKDTLVDLTAARYNQDTYYPVGINLNEVKRHVIQIHTSLNNLSHPYWATHGGGFSVTCGWEVNRTGWGAASPDRVVNVFSYGFTGVSPVGGLDQMSPPSWEVVWLRGGGVYNISIPRTSSIIYGDNNGTLYWTDGYYSDIRLAKAYDANTVPVAVNQLTTANASAVNTLKINVQSINGVQTSHAEQLSNLSTTVGNNTVTIGTQQTSINGVRAVHALKIDNNGVITGYGLVSELIDGVVKSQFGVTADTFFIGAPASGKKPFIVLADTGEINGVVVPAGTYIDTAFIADLTVTSAKIADLGVTNAKIANLAVDGAKIANAAITTAKIGDLQVDTLKIKDNAVTVTTVYYVDSYQFNTATAYSSYTGWWAANHTVEYKNDGIYATARLGNITLGSYTGTVMVTLTIGHMYAGGAYPFIFIQRIATGEVRQHRFLSNSGGGTICIRSVWKNVAANEQFGFFFATGSGQQGTQITIGMTSFTLEGAKK